MNLADKTWASDEHEAKKAKALEVKESGTKKNLKEHGKEKTDASTLCMKRLS